MLDPDSGEAALLHTELSRGSEADVDGAARDIRTAVIDLDLGASPGVEVGDAGARAEGQGATGGRCAERDLEFCQSAGDELLRLGLIELVPCETPPCARERGDPFVLRRYVPIMKGLSRVQSWRRRP
jgi:hypothetical protein